MHKKTCSVCGKAFKAKRSDASACGSGCRAIKSMTKKAAKLERKSLTKSVGKGK